MAIFCFFDNDNESYKSFIYMRVRDISAMIVIFVTLNFIGAVEYKVRNTIFRLI